MHAALVDADFGRTLHDRLVVVRAAEAASSSNASEIIHSSLSSQPFPVSRHVHRHG
jgi:hypothetical protein